MDLAAMTPPFSSPTLPHAADQLGTRPPSSFATNDLLRHTTKDYDSYRHQHQGLLFYQLPPPINVPNWMFESSEDVKPYIESCQQLVYLAPIEHLWDVLGRRVADNHPPPADVAQLTQFLQQEWQAIPQQTLTTLVHSMRQRCRECVAQNGGHTHY